jgi:hypothetical protein
MSLLTTESADYFLEFSYAIGHYLDSNHFRFSQTYFPKMQPFDSARSMKLKCGEIYK